MIYRRSNRLDVVYWTLNPIRPRSRDTTSSSPPLKPLTTPPKQRIQLQKGSKQSSTFLRHQANYFISLAWALYLLRTAERLVMSPSQPTLQPPASPNATSRGREGGNDIETGEMPKPVCAGRGKSSAETQGAESCATLATVARPKSVMHSPRFACSSPNFMQYVVVFVKYFFLWLQPLAKNRELFSLSQQRKRMTHVWWDMVVLVASYFFMSCRPLRASTTRNALFRVFPSAPPRLYFVILLNYSGAPWERERERERGIEGKR